MSHLTWRKGMVALNRVPWGLFILEGKMYKCKVKGCKNKHKVEGSYCEECMDMMFSNEGAMMQDSIKEEVEDEMS